LQDIKNLKKQLTPEIPESADQFMLLLKRYANLLFALFQENSPLFLAMKTIITALKAFSRPARESMSKRTKASILWIILLQSRQFAIGETNILAEFSTMQANLSAKNGLISHAEVPIELVETVNKKKRKNESNQDKTTDDNPSTRQKTSNPNKWHPRIRSALQEPLQKAGNPSFSKILTYIGKSAEEVYPLIGRKCAPNTFLGKCFGGDKFARDHTLPTDEEVNHVLSLTEKLVNNPMGLTQGK
jgi:hypothetical protein